MGYRVVQAMDAEQAISILMEGCQPDLLFTDIRLPGSMDGWQLAEAARQECPDIPVIYATGYTDVQARTVSGGIFLVAVRAAVHLGVPPSSGN